MSSPRIVSPLSSQEIRPGEVERAPRPPGGALAVVAAGAASVTGVALALSGFSAATMLATTVNGAVALVWLRLAAVWSWRRAVVHRP